MVNTWEANVQKKGAGVTPGRVSRVFTTHVDTIEMMQRDDWESLVEKKWRPTTKKS